MRKYDQIDLLPSDDSDPVADLVSMAAETYAPSEGDLARRVGVQLLALTQWKGRKRRPSPSTLKKIAQELLRQSDELRYLSLQLEGLAAREAKQKKRRPRRAPAKDTPASQPSQKEMKRGKEEGMDTIL